MATKILNTKAESYALFAEGYFGNHLNFWMSVEEFEKSKFLGKVTARYKVPNSPFMKYDLTPAQLFEHVENCVRNHGADRKLFVVFESAPDDRIVVQGEFIREPRGAVFFASFEKKKMRDALKNGQEYVGMAATAIIKRYMTPPAYSNFQRLDEEFDGSVMELSIYSMNLGVQRFDNSIIWEIRSTF